MRDMNKLFVYFAKGSDTARLDYKFKSTVRHAVLLALEYEGVQFDSVISFTLTDNAGIRELNSKHRGVDKHTDVLSFPMYEREELSDFAPGMRCELGDIVISHERAREQADELGNTYLEEIAFLTVHSVLHLLGYDHERSDEDDELQCEHQREIIRLMKTRYSNEK